jgi:hypothetical protein
MRFIFGFLLLLPALAFADDFSRVRFGGEGELYLPVPIENAIPDGDRLRIRSVELTAQSSFDDLAPGLFAKLTLGGEDTSGDLTLNIREGFIGLSSGGFTARAGKFFLPVGILNQTRRSAWEIISAPRPIALFFAEAGVVDTGVDLAYANDTFEMRAGVTNGYRYDSAVLNTGTKPMTPTHFARPSFTFHSGNSRIAIAADYVGRVSDDGTSMRVAGVDAALMPTAADLWAWQGQLEAYHRYVKPTSIALSEELGGYLLVEKGLGASSLLGLRFDAYKIPSLKFASGDERKNMTLAVSPVYTYRARDHVKMQLAYTYLKETRDGDTARAEQSFEFRVVTEFGDIPKFRTPSPTTLGPSSL